MSTDRSKLIAAGVAAVLVVAALAWYVRRDAPADSVIDLVELLPQAERRTANPAGPQGIVATAVTIDGDEKKSIVARPQTRLIYDIQVPASAWFETSFALDPSTWDLPGDGAQFRVGVSDGRVYDELLRQYVNPKRGDRRWFTARLDLSAYEGRRVKVILNTDPGPPGSSDIENDIAVWAAPRVFSQD